ISTRAQAEALVAACKYPPRGYRSFGPVRASLYAGSDYGDRADDDIVVMPMIETAEALKNLDAILSVPGVAAIYVGPADLSLALALDERAAYLGVAASVRARALASLEAPDFTLPDLDGRLHTLSNHRGKKVLLVAYASW